MMSTTPVPAAPGGPTAGAAAGPVSGHKPRFDGVDAVRGLAVLGMFAVHLGVVEDDSGDGWGWIAEFRGRSAAAFALLVGVSVALLARGRDVRHSRVRIATRGVLLVLLGMVLTELNTGAHVILVHTGVMLLLAVIAVRWRSWVLGLLAAVFVTVGPFAWRAMGGVRHSDPGGLTVLSFGAFGGERAWAIPAVVDAFWTVSYPLVVWLAYLCVGVVVGRTDLRSGRTLAVLAGAGCGLVAAGYGVRRLVIGAWPGGAGGKEGEPWWLSAGPHSNTGFEVVANIGVTLLLIAAFCALARIATRVLLPLAAVGAMALTAYTGHLVFMWAVGIRIAWHPDNGMLLAVCAVTVAFAVAWRRFLGRGPLERVLHAVSMRMVGAAPPKAATADDHPPLTRCGTGTATSSNAASTGSNHGATSPPITPNGPREH